MNKRKIFFIIVLVIAIVVCLKIIQTGINMIRVINHTYVQETDTFLGYMLTKNNQPYLIRCEKEAKANTAIYQKYDTRISITISFHSGKNGLPATEDRKTLDSFEQSFLKKIIAAKELGLGGYVIGGRKEEIFLYTNNVKKLQNIFTALQKEFPSYKLSFQNQPDKNWNYYNAYCIHRQFPK